MLVMDEYIDHWYIHKTKYDYVTCFMDWWKQDLTEMVEMDYNHPSVVLYPTGNEVPETAQEKGITLTPPRAGPHQAGHLRREHLLQLSVFHRLRRIQR